MMLLRKKTILGLFLCTLVFSSSIPMLLGIQASPEEVFGGEIITLSQVNSSVELKASLANELSESNQTVIASAEIYAFGIVKNKPVVIRGVSIESFLQIENGSFIEGNVTDPDDFTVIGNKLARRVGLSVGDMFVLTGSTRPCIFQLKVDAIFTGETGSDDLLIPLPMARKIAGLSMEATSVISIRTTNQTALVEDLEDKEQPVVVNEPGGTSSVVATNITTEQYEQIKLTLKYLEPAQFRASNGSYVSLFIQEGENSIKVVIVTFSFLVGGLTFIGASAILARAIIERRHDIGILSAIGANRGNIRQLIIKDILLISVPASLLGVLGGYLLVKYIETSGLLLMFGQTITPLLNETVIASTLTATIIICVVSGIIVNEVIMRATPQRLMLDTDKTLDETTVPSLISCLEVSE